ncbi:hypothetical protein [Ferrimonas balearica]|uniref:hypothetical protein n=1 Tax=Ferrimonas balearica TaxID=44012 RepID=UPI001F1B1111|nr:hypothetical protein [Ferrimonas balearica]MBY6019104.1 hypothetical protein [Halomonas denitrificans]MBY6095708.1 hypothetical protein [Ferrimonas balearica]
MMSERQHWRLGLLAALLPLLTTHLSYGLSLWEAWIPACNPYWADCVSISRTGRHGSAYWWFKGLMLPACLLLAVFWWQAARWLQQQGLSPGPLVLPLAMLASLALAVYTLTLGHATGHFPVIRRVGIAGFILFTYLVQVAVGAALYRAEPWRWAGNRVLGLASLTLAIALLTLVWDGLWSEAYERWEDAFEWWLFLLLNSQLFLMLWIARFGQPERSI